MIIKINHKLTAFNLNQMMRSRGGINARSASKKKLDRDLYFLIKPQVKNKLEGVYQVVATWLVPDLNRDLDNMLLKSIFDCMQENNLLVNDNAKHITQITHKYEKVKIKDQGVIIEFIEVV